MGSNISKTNIKFLEHLKNKEYDTCLELFMKPKKHYTSISDNEYGTNILYVPIDYYKNLYEFIIVYINNSDFRTKISKIGNLLCYVDDMDDIFESNKLLQNIVSNFSEDELHNFCLRSYYNIGVWMYNRLLYWSCIYDNINYAKSLLGDVIDSSLFAIPVFNDGQYCKISFNHDIWKVIIYSRESFIDYMYEVNDFYRTVPDIERYLYLIENDNIHIDISGILLTLSIMALLENEPLILSYLRINGYEREMYSVDDVFVLNRDGKLAETNIHALEEVVNLVRNPPDNIIGIHVENYYSCPEVYKTERHNLLINSKIYVKKELINDAMKKYNHRMNRCEPFVATK